MTAEHTCVAGRRSGCELCRRLDSDLWTAINRYAASVGGDPSRHVYGNGPRMQAVVDVGAAVTQLVEQRSAERRGAAAQHVPTNPDCTGTVGKDFAACGEEGYYCSDRCWTIGRLKVARAQVAEYEHQLGARSRGPGDAP